MIESFRFPAFVTKKIEYIRFWNKILDWNKTFSISTRKFRFKHFCSGPFSNFFETIKSLIWLLKILAQFETFWFRFAINVLFWILSSLEQTKTFRVCSDYKRTKSKRFGSIKLLCFVPEFLSQNKMIYLQYNVLCTKSKCFASVPIVSRPNQNVLLSFR